MKILHVFNVPFVIPYMLGDQITYMNSKGYEIHVACSNGEKIEQYIKKWNFIFFSLNITRSISPINDIISIFKLYKYIKQNNIDIVIGHTPKGGLISMIASFISSIDKRIYFRHGLLSDTSIGINKIIFDLVEKLTSYFSTTTICVSNSIYNKSISSRLTTKRKLKILNKGTCNGIDVFNEFNNDLVNVNDKIQLLSHYNLDNTNIIVGFIGRLSKDKGINELINAWKIVKNNNFKIKLILCGPIDERDPISNELLNYIINDDSIIYCGEIESTKLYYSIFSFFILPSYREGFPTVVLEASSMKNAVITTRCTGCIDSIIENQTGIFTDINEKAIADSIQFYIDNPNIANLHGENGRKFVTNNFQQKKIWEEIINIF